MKKAVRYINLSAWGALLFLAILYWTPLANRMADLLTVPAQEQKADVIVILAGGVYENGVINQPSMERLVHGLTLYHRGLAERVIITGGNPEKYEGITEAGSIAKVAYGLAVPSNAVFMDQVSNTTHENAVEVKKLLQRMGAGKALLVTSSYHMKRALGAFRAEGIEAYSAPVPAREPYLGKWDRVKLFGVCIHEYLGVIWYSYKGWYKR